MTFNNFKTQFSEMFSGAFPMFVACHDCGNNEFSADFHNYKGDSLDGIQVIYENGVYEVSEYQAGENKQELHVFKEYKSPAHVFNFITKLNNGQAKPKPIKVWS
jgi:hypothetical protein